MELKYFSYIRKLVHKATHICLQQLILSAGCSQPIQEGFDVFTLVGSDSLNSLVQTGFTNGAFYLFHECLLDSTYIILKSLVMVSAWGIQ